MSTTTTPTDRTSTSGSISEADRSPNAGRPNPIDTFLEALAAGDGVPPEIYSADATLDATVPHWRFGVTGGAAIAEELSRWYADRATIERLDRRRVVGVGDDLAGTRTEAVEVDLTWTENGVPHAAHQLHLITVGDGVIVSDTVFCGGRWPADLLAEMEAARAR